MRFALLDHGFSLGYGTYMGRLVGSLIVRLWVRQVWGRITWFCLLATWGRVWLGGLLGCSLSTWQAE